MKRNAMMLWLALMIFSPVLVPGQEDRSIDPDDEILEEDLGGDYFDDLGELEELDDYFDGHDGMPEDDGDDREYWNDWELED